MTLPVTVEDAETLTQGDTAAYAARDRWLATLRPKQFPPAGDWTQLIWKSGRGFGKALDVNTPIPTPTGWTSMGELCPGDLVFDENGHICTVIEAWPVMQGRPCYRVRFSDGEEIIADEDHLWLTWTKQARKARHRATRPQSDAAVRTTAEIRATLKVSSKREANHSIPCTGSLVLTPIELDVDPYVLGAWLGDGTSAGAVMVIAEDEMRETLERAGAVLKPMKMRPGKTPLFGVPMLGGPFLRTWRLRKNKHIPAIYLRASHGQRLALLQGLMDTDGHAHDKNGTCEFTNTNERLARDTLELIRSLGLKPTMTVGRATLYGKDCGPKYRVHFTAYFPVFRLPRKAARQQMARAQSLRQTQRYIVGVDPIGSVPVRCITVDSPSSLYLAGRAMIPTHNTRSEVEWAWWEGWRTGQPLIGHAVAPTLGDVKGTVFEGPSGFQAIVPPECLYRGSWELAWNKSSSPPVLTMANGTIIKGFGAQEQGGRLRGPQCHFAIGDELREWDRPAGNLEFVHSNMMLGVRLPYPDGSPARAVFGTTPKAIPYLKSLYKQPGVVVITGSTYENLKNLNQAFANTILAKEGTKIGRVEIHAEDIDGEEDGIFKKSWLRLWPPFKKLPEFTYIVQSMDTAFEEENSIDVKKGKEPDFSACSTLGIFNTAQCFTEEERKRLKIKSKYAALLCDFWMERLGFPDLLEAARKSYRTKWGQPGRMPDVVLIEKKASGISLRQTLMQYGVPTSPYDPHNQSKTMRAHTISPLVFQGMLFVPESTREDRKGQVRDWADPLVDQMTMFAGEGTIEYDDGLDTITQAMIYLMERGYFHAEPQGRAFPDFDEKEDMERKQAQEIAAREKRGKQGNPYGQ